jgi:hypothetical protein
MTLIEVLYLVDEFGRSMRDAANAPGSVSPAALNQQRLRLHDAIRRIAQGEKAKEQAVLVASAAIKAASAGRTNTTLTDGSPVTQDHTELRHDGQQKGYVVLSAEERAKGFVRPVRRSYVHDKCGGVTTMGLALAETYAREPAFYSGTFCAVCRTHFPVGADGEFAWDGTTERVGT